MLGASTQRIVHLLCNSHLDPVWLWEWPEGAGQALALARTVCDLCEEYRGFVFNRNEAQFYEWVEEYDAALFARIRRLVTRGQWHVMGGWYLQPDCNMPSGESFVRQILVGKRYFREKFGVEPTAAVNFDSFGHSRGLVQILAKSGYDSYLFCRPKVEESALPAAEFIWAGFDGSEVTAAVAESHYNSPPGGARRKIEEWMAGCSGTSVCQVPWGVGDHGGGPSRVDLEQISRLIDATNRVRITHSTPEQFFDDLREHSAMLPRYDGDLNPWAVGCYTSMMRVKRQHRRLENELYLAEKMATTAWAQSLLEYPSAELREATRAMLANEFHDILPGTSIPSVEQAVLGSLGLGLTIAARVKTRAFFALAAGQKSARLGAHPILVYNPHPFVLRTVVECELQPDWPDRAELYGVPTITVGQRRIPAQAEQEESNINEDHRKRVVFVARLAPSSMSRFDCGFEKVASKPKPLLEVRGGQLRFRTPHLEVVVNARTGLIDRYRIQGVDYLHNGAGCPLVMRDNADPWGMTVTRFRTPAGRFRLMSRADAARFAGVAATRLSAVRVVEDGPVRAVVEALLRYGQSAICQRYRLPRNGTELEIETRVLWQEKDRMLKLALPTPWSSATLRGQVAYGVQDLATGGDEVVAQKWLAVVSRQSGPVLTVVNDATHGCDFACGELRLSLLRAPAYAGHPTGAGRFIVAQDRFVPRLDQGEHVFRFWLNGGPAAGRLASVDREALAHNEEPYAVVYWPDGKGEAPNPGPVLSDRAIQVTAFKRAEDNDDLIVRLFEPAGRSRSTTLSVPCVGVEARVRLKPFELKTLRLSRRSRQSREVDLLEE